MTRRQPILNGDIEAAEDGSYLFTMELPSSNPLQDIFRAVCTGTAKLISDYNAMIFQEELAIKAAIDSATTFFAQQSPKQSLKKTLREIEAQTEVAVYGVEKRMQEQRWMVKRRGSKLISLMNTWKERAIQGARQHAEDQEARHQKDRFTAVSSHSTGTKRGPPNSSSSGNEATPTKRRRKGRKSINAIPAPRSTTASSPISPPISQLPNTACPRRMGRKSDQKYFNLPKLTWSEPYDVPNTRQGKADLGIKLRNGWGRQGWLKWNDLPKVDYLDNGYFVGQNVEFKAIDGSTVGKIMEIRTSGAEKPPSFLAAIIWPYDLIKEDVKAVGSPDNPIVIDLLDKLDTAWDRSQFSVMLGTEFRVLTYDNPGKTWDRDPWARDSELEKSLSQELIYYRAVISENTSFPRLHEGSYPCHNIFKVAADKRCKYLEEKRGETERSTDPTHVTLEDDSQHDVVPKKKRRGDARDRTRSKRRRATLEDDSQHDVVPKKKRRGDARDRITSKRRRARIDNIGHLSGRTGEQPSRSSREIPVMATRKRAQSPPGRALRVCEKSCGGLPPLPDDPPTADDDLSAVGDDLSIAGDDLPSLGDDLLTVGNDLPTAGDHMPAVSDERDPSHDPEDSSNTESHHRAILVNLPQRSPTSYPGQLLYGPSTRQNSPAFLTSGN